MTQVVNTADKRPLWIAEQANASGQITRYTLGDGSVTERVYKEETGLIESIATTRGSATLMNQGYTFDHIGNLKERSDNLYGVVQSFCHDEMNRLSAARFDGCAASDADYTYDPLGNITSKTEVGSYAYDQTGNAGPHAVTAANGLTFEYDAAGNLLRARNSSNQIVREVTWSAINKPTRISNNSHWSEIHYGPDESRIKREDSTGRATYYFGSLYEETTYGMQAHRIHAIGDFALYIEDAYTGQGYHEYLHRDHLDSVVARTTDKDTADNEWLAYGARGNRLLVAWDGIEEGPEYQAPSVRGYTGHEHLDPIGLIDMGGRIFDPELGRFLSPDPFVQAPYNTQSYNRYSYVFNNPLSFTDPSGYQATCPYDQNGCTEEVIVTGPSEEELRQKQIEEQREAIRQSSIEIMRQYSSQQQDYVNFAADQIYQAALANGGSTIIYENGQLYQITVGGAKGGATSKSPWEYADVGLSFADPIVGASELMVAGALAYSVSKSDVNGPADIRNNKWTPFPHANALSSSKTLAALRAGGSSLFFIGTGVSLWNGSQAVRQGNGFGVVNAGVDLVFGVAGFVGGSVGAVGAIFYTGSSAAIKHIPGVYDYTVAPIVNAGCAISGC